ncbi:MAG: 50S ribosomal protein L4, partial [Gemmatimonadota bacterium]|nr:50S ribosomal protein L4 [Gemmatimonadota bacterium]
LARKSALNARLGENALIVVDKFEFDAPKTSRVVALMARLGLDGKKVLILTDGAKTNVFLSARNLPTVHVMPYSDVSTYHILWSDTVVIEAPAIGQELEPVAESAPAPTETAKRAAAKKESAAKGEAKDARKKEKTAKKIATKSAAKKSNKPAAKTSTKTTAKKSAVKKPSAPKKKGK